MPADDPKLPNDSIQTPLLLRAALDELRASLLAMPEEDVQRVIPLDAKEAAGIAEAASSKVAAYRDQLLAQFPAGGVWLDELPLIARATRQADIELAATAKSNDLGPLHDEVRKAYQGLLTDAEGLVNHGHLDGALLENARDIQGYQALLQSTFVLVQVLRTHWTSLAGKTLMTVEHLDRAELAAQRMVVALGDRDHGVSRAPAAELRLRALNRLVFVYDEVRRMVMFLRFRQEDWDETVPSLFARRGRRRSTGGVEDVVTEDTGVPPVGPGPNNGGPAFTS